MAVTAERVAAPRADAGCAPALNLTWTVAGSAVRAATSWATLAVLVRLGTPSEVAHFALALALTAPVALLLGGHLRAALMTDVEQRAPLWAYSSLRLVSIVLLVGAGTGLAVLCADEASAAWTVALVAAAKGLELLTDLAQGLLQRHRQMDLAARALAAHGVTELVLFTVLLAAGASLPQALAGRLVAQLAVLACVEPGAVGHALQRTGSQVRHAALRGVVTARRNPRDVVALAVATAPLGVVLALGSVAAVAPRLALAHVEGLLALSWFAPLVYLMQPASLLAVSLGEATTPRLARAFVDGDRDGFSRTLRRNLIAVVALGAGLALSSLLFGRAVLELVYGPAFAHHVDVLVGLALVSCLTFVCSCLGYALTATRAFAPQLPLAALQLLTTCAALVVLTPSHGVPGALLAMALAGGVDVAVKGFLLSRVLRHG